jgi:predicted acylesterase/phospholipase RssA
MARDNGRNSQPSLGIALSGGGIRAALFSLGAMLYMCHSGLRRRVRVITSVSGGSITNAALVSAGDLATMESLELQRAIVRAGRALAKEGAFFLPSRKRLVASALLGVAFPLIYTAITLVLLGSALFTTTNLVILGLFVPATVAWFVFVLLLSRAPSQIRAYDKIIARSTSESSNFKDRFQRQEKQTLSSLSDSSVCHIFCATELNSGQPFYLTPRWLYTPAFGWGNADLKVSEAVYASAAFPGAFPPLKVSVDQLDMSGGSVAHVRPKHFLLADGGVFNNFGTEWFEDASEASTRLYGTDDRFEIPTEVDAQIVVNASAPPRVTELDTKARWRRPWSWVPLRNVQTFLRIISILYENTLEPRMRAFERESDEYIVLDISVQPNELARTIRDKSQSPEVKLRAEKMFKRLSELDKYWDEFIRRTSLTPTKLSFVGVDLATALMRHGYLMAAIACHARFDTPGIDKVPDEYWFDQLLDNPEATDQTLAQHYCQTKEAVDTEAVKTPSAVSTAEEQSVPST